MTSFAEMRVAMLKQSTRWSDRAILGKLVSTEAPPPEPVEITDNDIILGSSSTTYSKENLKMLDIRRVGSQGEYTTFTSLILGQAGGGKSYQGAVWYLDNLHDRFHIPLMIIDPKHEWHEHRKASFEEANQKRSKIAIDNFFTELGGAEAGMVRHGYEMIVISPWVTASIEKNKLVDRYFAPSYAHIKYIAGYDFDEGIKIFMELLGLDTTDDNYIDLLRVVMIDKKIETFAELKEAIKKKARRYSTVRGRILRKLDIQLRLHTITDDPEHIINIFDLLKKYIVIFQTKLKSTNKDAYSDMAFNAIIKVVNFMILIACIRHNLEHKESELEECAVLWDELDLYANENEESSTRDFVTFQLTKGRGAGIHWGGIAQEASLVYHELFANVKVISTSVVTPNNAKAIKDRHVSKDYVDVESGKLAHLKVKQKTNLFTEVPERATIDEANKITVYYPFPSKSAHAHR